MMTETELRYASHKARISMIWTAKKGRWIRVSVEMLEHDAFAGEPFSKPRLGSG